MALLDPELRKEGLPLSEWGANETAWDKQRAKMVTEICASAGLAILGGDVWRQERDGRWRPTGDNWFSEKGPGEEISAFVRRSRVAADDYLDRYPLPGDGSVRFVIVCSEA